MIDLASIGEWLPDEGAASFAPAELASLIARVREPIHVVRERDGGRIGVAIGGQIRATSTSRSESSPRALPLLGTLPALYPEWLGDRSFCEAHGVRFPYVAGEMANGIATARMVIALGNAGMLGLFGAAGLAIAAVEKGISSIRAALGDRGAWGVNLIHSPQEPAHEEALAALLIDCQVPCVSASAFMGLTPALVRASIAGITRDASGKIRRRRRVIAKVSRPEVAEHFLSPAPLTILRALVSRSLLTEAEAALAANIPIAEDITVEADSGGHTDNRPLTVVLPAILALRDRLAARHSFDRPIRIGAAGGLGTPSAIAAAFSLGSAYVLTGSINQASLESGLSERGRALLAKADLADVAMAPSADMFELGVKVQVLKRGTLFAARATRLYELYTHYDSLAALSHEQRARLEREIFGKPLSDALTETIEFWQARQPAEVDRARRDPKHEMALLFRSYLGLSSRWAIAGDEARQSDYQIWCGPAMGAFNRWAAGSFLEAPVKRGVVQMALNLLEGAAVVTRAQQLRTYGGAVPSAAFDFRPRPIAED